MYLCPGCFPPFGESAVRAASSGDGCAYFRAGVYTVTHTSQSCRCLFAVRLVQSRLTPGMVAAKNVF